MNVNHTFCMMNTIIAILFASTVNPLANGLAAIYFAYKSGCEK